MFLKPQVIPVTLRPEMKPTFNINSFIAHPVMEKALTLENLKLCNQHPQNVIQTKLKCKEDETCVKCLQNESGLQNLAKQFTSDEMKSTFQIYLHMRFGKPTRELIIVVMVADRTFMKFIANWKLSSAIHNDVSFVVIPTDKNAFNEATLLGLKKETMPVHWNCDKCPDGFLTKSYYPKNLQIHVTNILVQLEYNVILQDAGN